jgi:hypothetical protein
MTDAAVQDRDLGYIARLEEALAEYAHLYGLTPRARTLFQERGALDRTNGPEREELAGTGSPSATALGAAPSPDTGLSD